MNLGKTIKGLRRQKGISQLELAERCGVTSTYLSQIENNRKSPSPELSNALAIALEVPVPILYFMALEESDIPSDKREAYQYLAPGMKTAIGQLFPASRE